ncbi:MAG: translocation/assembly module TamB domain-containing protein [Cyanobacteria bacterium P01_G01_bin.54]
MTDTTSTESTQPKPRPPWWRRRYWLWLLLLVPASAGAGWFGLQHYLQPFIEQQVANTLDRPVELGRVTGISLNRIHFGPTRLPAQPDDADYGLAQAVDVRFTPLKVALQRRLELEITLKDASAYVAQDETRAWLNIPEFEEGNLPIKIRVTALRIQNAALDLVKLDEDLQPTEPLQLQVDGGALLIRDGVKDMGIEQLRGEFVAGGRFAIGGNVAVEGDSWEGLGGKLAAQIQDINLAEVARMLPPLPLEVQQGEVSGNTIITLVGNPLNLETVPELTGVARLKNVVVATPLVTPKVTVERGDLRLQGDVVRLDGWRTRLGEIPVRVGGTLSAADEQANRLVVQLEPTTIATLLETFEYDDLIPVPVTGAIALNAAVFGPLDEPQVIGRITNACPGKPADQRCELRVDRLPFKSFRADFQANILKQTAQVTRVQLQPRAGGQILAQGSGQLKGAQPVAQLRAQFLDLPADALLSTYGVPLPVPVGTLAGQAQVTVPVKDWQKLQATVTAQLLGGRVDIRDVELRDQQWSGTVTAQNLRLPAPLPIQNVNVRLPVRGRLDRVSLDALTVESGQAQAQVGQGWLSASRLTLQQGRFTAIVEAQNAELGAIATPFLPAQLAALPIGNLNNSLAIEGRLRGAQLPDLVGRGAITLGLAGGVATRKNLELTNNQLDTQIQAKNLDLAQFTALVPTELPINASELGIANADLELNTNLASLLQGNVAALLGQTNLEIDAKIAGLSGGNGEADITLNQRQWQTELRGRGLQPTRILPQLPSSLAQSVSGDFTLGGTVPQQVTLNSLSAQGNGNVQLATGHIELPKLELNQGRFTAQARPSQLALHPFHPLLRGQLAGDVRVAIPLHNVTALTAAGRLNLNQGVSLVTNPLAIDFQWGGERLRLERLHAKDQLTATGTVDFNLAQILAGAIGPDVIRNVDLSVDARNLPLQEGLRDLQQLVTLPVETTQISLGGAASFQGTVQGTVRAPEVAGDLTLDRLALNRWAFDPQFTGPVSIRPGGSTVNLVGERDRLDVALDNRYLPTSFDVQLQDLHARGVREGNLLKTTVENLSLRRLKGLLPPGLLPPLVAAQPLSGKLTGRFDVDLNTWGIAGQVAIAPFVLGPLQASEFSGGVQYVGGAIALENAELTTGNTRYGLSGRLIPTGSDPEVQAQVEIIQGDLRDILAALEIAKISDLLRLSRTVSAPAKGSAADLDTVAVGDGNAPLQAQLDRLSEILTLNQQRQQESIDALPLPPLEFVSGAISGHIVMGGPLKDGFNGVQGEVDLQGEDWEWGNYVADRVTIKGSLQEGVVAIQPFELQSGEGSILLSGVFGADSINGQVQVTDLPIITLQDLIPLPPAIGLGGQINATATLAGDRSNPQVLGRVNITDANINDTPIDTATANLNYNQSLLRFRARSTLIEGGTPLTLTGRIPYQLPIPGTSPPADYGVELTAKLQDDGLAILNIITRQQLAWQQGQAAVDVTLKGWLDPETLRLAALTADGDVRLADGVMRSALLPDEPLTDLQGHIHLNFDQIDVEQLTGQFGGGAIAIAGSLPTFQRRAPDNPLTLQMQQLTVALKGVFAGTIDGQVQVLGTALAPEITGQVGVSNGQVQLLGVAALSNAVAAEEGSGGGLASLVEFRDLQIALTNDFILRQFPILEFAARGNLTLNGVLPNLEPDGDIDLTRGYLNLFTTNFRLDNEYRNQALLSSITGLDPYLDLRLIGSVLETERRAFAVETVSSEVEDRSTNLGSIQSLRVQAEVQASALELIETLSTSNQTGLGANNRLITLTSSPRRSETEILALLGGTFVNSVAGGDNTALVGGLANIAGSALFGDVQRTISDAFGLNEFRVFPAQVIDDDEEADSSAGTLGIAVELSKSLSDRASVSVFQFLTPPNQPARFNVRYRIDDNFTVRGSSDLRGDDRAVLEYEVRF